MPGSHPQNPKKKPAGLDPSPATVTTEETRPPQPTRQPAFKPWKPISILQAIHVCLCMMIFPYLLTVTLSRLPVNFWLAALISIIIGTGIFLLLYRRTKDVKLFKFE